MKQEDQFFWFNEEQYNSDGGFYNAEQQYFQGGSTSDYGHGLQISEAINYRDGGFTGLYNDMHQFQVGFTSNHGLQNSEAVNTIADQQIQLSPEIILLEVDSQLFYSISLLYFTIFTYLIYIYIYIYNSAGNVYFLVFIRV